MYRVGSAGGQEQMVKKTFGATLRLASRAAANRFFTIIALWVKQLGSAEKTSDERRPTTRLRIAAGDLLFSAGNVACSAGGRTGLHQRQTKRGSGRHHRHSTNGASPSIRSRQDQIPRQHVA